jgi:predicted ribosome quality control (RQC) complex YloA/Tae2 family protein
MHNHHLFLQQLSQRLDQTLQGYSLVSCFSQNKEELIMEFNNSSGSFFIKSYLHPDFCCLSFPSKFQRARKNSVDLFSPLILKKVIRVQAFENERCFSVEFPDKVHLLFKMFGNQSNIILFQNGVITEIFRQNLKNDLSLTLETLASQKPPYFENQGQRNYNSGVFYIVQSQGKISFSLAPDHLAIREFTNPFEALNEFFYLKISTDAFRKAKDKALKMIQEKEKKTRLYLAQSSQELNALSNDDHYKAWANLIMANLHNIKKGDEKISVKDFETDNAVEIKLKKELTPQQNAAIYYRKAKNKHLELKKLTGAIFEKEQLAKKLQEFRQSIEAATSVEKINELLNTSGIPNRKKDQSERLPYRVIEFKDYTILIGRSAKDNDELTLKHTYKEDLWLHAKDVSGSHVVIKHQSGKNFPKDVIERAAQLAAFHSRRKGESLCPVAYTAKKYVRKRKGDPAGLVVVEKETVILAEPKG